MRINMSDEDREFYYDIYKDLYGENKREAMIKVAEQRLAELMPRFNYFVILDYIDSLPEGSLAEENVDEVELVTTLSDEVTKEPVSSEQVELNKLNDDLKAATEKYENTQFLADKKKVTEIKRKITIYKKKYDIE